MIKIWNQTETSIRIETEHGTIQITELPTNTRIVYKERKPKTILIVDYEEKVS